MSAEHCELLNSAVRGSQLLGDLHDELNTYFSNGKMSRRVEIVVSRYVEKQVIELLRTTDLIVVEFYVSPKILRGRKLCFAQAMNDVPPQITPVKKRTKQRQTQQEWDDCQISIEEST